MPYALCALRDVEATMPAIASLEDLKAAQKDLLSAKELHELKATFKNGVASDGKIFARYGLRSALPNI